MRYRSATIWPGTNRPPPIESDFSSDAEGCDGARGVRGAGVCGGLRGVVGSSVLPIATGSGSLPRMVASASWSSDTPQAEQKRAWVRFFAAQEEQNMGRRDSIIAPACGEFFEYAQRL